ncbi:hypothetical protein GNF76_15530 [Pseudomonas sp. CCM 7893]|uniref:Uncharacterized protein n=1 Tax=Pseudomonas spelaei TaxID=1055469 RepID=A0A6I3W689_9PSED|nr:hypothetical protein [Pseudomonas spelaei]MUF05765.1 hypothetical protein [Pseudomonas spelaei]
MRATAFQAALTQTNKSCSNGDYNTQAQVNTNPQRQQNVNKAADAVNAIGGLFKYVRMPCEKGPLMPARNYKAHISGLC